MFLPNPPDYSQLESELAWEKTSFIERSRRRAEEPIISNLSDFSKCIKRKLFQNKNTMFSLVINEMAQVGFADKFNIVDIGCGSGVLLFDIHKACAERGFMIVPIGIEVSKELSSQTKNKMDGIGGVVIHASAIQAIAGLEENSIHIVIMNSFLEHEKDPFRLMSALRAILSPKGSIIIKVPNFACWNRVIRGNRWCGFRYPDHVNYFTPRTLEILAKATGFVVVRQTLLDKFPTADNMYAVLKKNAQQGAAPDDGKRRR